MPINHIDDQLKEKCAVFGIFGPKANGKAGLEAARLTFYGLWSLQHRGQESSGIASSDGKQIYRHAAAGLVATVYREEDLEQLPGHIAIGHNRYSTSGGTDDVYNQPFVEHKHNIAIGHNGNIPDTTKLEEFLHERKIEMHKKNDSAMMVSAISCYMDDGLDVVEAIKKAWPLFTGVFSIVAMTPDKLIAFRDQMGVRPLSVAKMGESYVVASETCAFDTIGAEYIRDVKPGELITVDKDGLHSEQVVEGEEKLDMFELVYFARPDSLMIGKRIDLIRQEFGAEMAREYPIEADVIVPVPDSGIPAALGYSQTSGIPFEMALLKNRYIHRTFIRPTTELRERDLKMKLNPVIERIKDQRVVLVDDSIVRGTTMRHLVQMIFDAGAKEVHLMISCPPVKYPDFYGINTPKQTELLAAYMTNEQMREHLGATSLNFLSYDGMVNSTGLPASNFTTSCFDGNYTVSIGKRAEEIVFLGENETLPIGDHKPIKLATARNA